MVWGEQFIKQYILQENNNEEELGWARLLLMQHVALGNYMTVAVLLVMFCPLYRAVDPNHSTLSSYADTADEGGRTCLHCAASRNDLRMVQLLLSYGADSRKRTKVLAKTPLDYCTSADIMAALISASNIRAKTDLVDK